ncbi:MAG: hypothetical protein JNL39_01165, partial [Opitutaceae bacterium]|nr:hypothetical protein [Opitutaceae bacterium]
MGDDPRWAAADLDDTGWEIVAENRLPLQAGIFWVRLHVRSRDSRGRLPSLVVMPDNKAHDLFCDGVLIHSSGVPGNSAREEVGPMALAKIELPAIATTPGEHVFAFRMSTYRRGYPGSAFTPLGFHLVPADKFHEQHSRLNMLCTLGL